MAVYGLTNPLPTFQSTGAPRGTRRTTPRGRAPRNLGYLESAVPWAGRAYDAASALTPDRGSPFSGMPKALMSRIESVAGASGAAPRFQQQMAQTRAATRGILGGGSTLAARMGAAGADIPGFRREAGRTYAEGAGNAAAQFAETAQRGTEAAAGMMQPLALDEMQRRSELERSRGKLVGNALRGAYGRSYGLVRRR